MRLREAGCAPEYRKEELFYIPSRTMARLFVTRMAGGDMVSVGTCSVYITNGEIHAISAHFKLIKGLMCED